MSTSESYLPAGVPDAFERLWTPHRMAYVGGENKPADASTDQCPFCAAPHRSDDEALIIARGELCYVILNLYPYNPGHLLVCPYRHVATYPELTVEERDEFGELTSRAMRVLAKVSKPDGCNVGMNQGDVAGAGIAAHLHQHIVPRWKGDANFFPIIAQTKALPQVLGDTRELLATGWNEC
ncbi:HIT family protein [Bowdeniella massiliensis]|uniref:HIT family protein n=1 Tax=Bowdeniella massiliensis TaxID=2932264 RepID=UPI002028AD11|nr:HIT domain-containing protein [Bowdeniella massiliensis]